MKSSLNPARAPRAFALILVLAFIVLLSGIIVAFFSRAITERQVSNSSLSEIRADILAHSAADVIVAGLKQEIKSRSNSLSSGTISSGSVTLYQPLTAADMLPVRSGTPALISGSDPIPNLVRRSKYGATDPAALTGSASNVSTSGTSINGRWIKSDRWNEHYLIPRLNVTATNNCTPISAFSIPDWVLLTGTGPTVLTTPTNTIIGRYSYVIYNEGGLLDINIAGYPSQMPSAVSPFPSVSTTGSYSEWGYARKGGEAFADLTQLSLASGTITQSQLDNIIGWRNYGSSQPSGSLFSGYSFDQNSAAKYFDSVLTASTGFITVPVTSATHTDQRFTSRQALLKFWKDMGFNENALQYLTTFSREKNAPVWEPLYNASSLSGTDAGVDIDGNAVAGYYAYKDNADLSTAFNRRLYNVRVVNAFTRLDGTKAMPGEPLIKYRFDLGKLDWIRNDGSLPSGITADDIYNYFGLTRNTDGSWNYNHGTPANGERINTLDEVANTGREPDLFELLQAGILRGSLGLCSGDPSKAATSGTAGGEYFRFRNSASVSGTAHASLLARSDNNGPVYAQEMYQIVQIGANMIDQADSDSFPTEIVLNGVHIYGVENLPYLNAIADTVLRPAAGGNPTPSDYQAYVHRWFTFSVWNPHQNAMNASISGTDSPVNFRILAADGSMYPTVFGLTTQNDTNNEKGSGVTDFSTTPEWLRFDLSEYQSGKFGEPTALDYDHSTSLDVSSANGRIQTTYGWKRAGIYIGYSYSPDSPLKVPACKPLYSSSANYPSIAYRAADYTFVGGVTLKLQYLPPGQDPNSASNWDNYARDYQVVYGFADWMDGRGDPYMEPNDPAWASVSGSWRSASQFIMPANDTEARIFQPVDPRSLRQNISSQRMYAVSSTNSLRLTNNAYINNDVAGYVGPHFPGAGAWSSFLNNLGTVSNGFYTDRDFVWRAGDCAGWGTKVSGTMSSPLISNDANASDPLKRPLLLNRPFRDVGELGFVFRDDPWKTLNLFAPSNPYAATSGSYGTTADSAVLDLFCIGPGPLTNQPAASVVAGKININSAPIPVLQTVIVNALRNYPASPGEPASLSGTDMITGSDSQTIAASIYKQLHPTVTGSASGPFFSISEMPCLLLGTNSQFPPNKMQREAVIRALGDCAGTRTWNLLVDIIAQSGKFGPNARKLDDFVVDGEKHYWLHVALDRFTGEVVDQQFELVSE